MIKDLGKILLVQVPEYAVSIELEVSDGEVWLTFADTMDKRRLGCIELPQGEYSHCKMAGEMSEEECKVIGLAKAEEGYLNYEDASKRTFASEIMQLGNPWHVSARFYKTALKSFHSLLRSHGFDPQNTVIVFKK